MELYGGCLAQGIWLRRCMGACFSPPSHGLWGRGCDCHGKGVSFCTNKDRSTSQVLHQWGCLFLTSVNISKEKPHLKPNWEAGRKNSHACNTQCTRLTPAGEGPHVSPEEVTLLPYLGRRRERSRLVQYRLSQWEATTTQPTRSHSASHSVSASGLSITTPAAKPANDGSSHSFLWTCVWFTIRYVSQIVILCCSRINPFCWWNVWLFVWGQHLHKGLLGTAWRKSLDQLLGSPT